MPRQFYLNCLGVPALRNFRDEPVPIRIRKHMALLVFLATQGVRLRRDTLIALLWPDVPQFQGRQSLATALSALRRALGPHAIEATREYAQLVPGAVTTDLEWLERGELDATADHPALELDGFLAGFELSECPEFQIWRDRQHARWLPRVHEGLHQQIEQARRRGDTRGMERSAEQLLAIDEFAEEGIRGKMEARAMAGDRITALRLYDDWIGRIASDLGASPSEALEGMAVRLRRRGWERTTQVQIPHVPTDHWKGRPFVGRLAEYRRLYETWEASQRGTPIHTLVTGDSGVGKTTLAARLATAISLEGASVARVQCFELERSIPYAAVSGLVTGLLDRPGAAGTPPEELAELARVIPAVGRAFPGLPRPRESQGEAAKIYFAEALHALLLALMEEHPVMLVLDDLPQADEASLAVLHLIARRCEGAPLILVATANAAIHSGGAHEGLPSGGALRFQPLVLGPLAEGESQELVRGLLPPGHRSPNPTEKRALVSAAGGIPMALELLTQDWVERGTESLALAVGAMTQELRAPPLTDYYHQLSDRMLADLDPLAGGVLRLASVLDRRLNDLGMYALVDVSPGQAMTALGELAARRALRDAGTGLEFTNQLIRAHIYLAHPGQLRRTLHSQVADRLITLRRNGTDVPGLEVAWHLVRSSRVEESIPWLLNGAREAIDAGALHEAELALRTGLGNLQQETLAEAHLLLAEVLQEMSRWEESIEVLTDVSGVPEALEERAEVLHFQAEAGLLHVDSEKLPEWIPRITGLITDGRDLSTRAMAAVALAMTDFIREADYREAVRKAVDTVNADDFTMYDKARILLARARIEYFSGQALSALDTIHAGLAAMGDSPPPNALSLKLNAGIAAIHSGLGQFDDAHSSFKTVFNMAIRLGNEATAARQAANLAMCEYVRSHFDMVETWATKAWELGGVAPGYYQLFAKTYHILAKHDLGKNRDVQMELGKIDQLRHSSVLWMDQAGLLQIATVNHYTGQQNTALSVGLEATSGKHRDLHAINFAGLYAFWIYMTFGARNDQAECLQRLCELHTKLAMLDITDKIEVLWALGCLTTNQGEGLALRNRAHELLSGLPETAKKLLTLRRYSPRPWEILAGEGELEAHRRERTAALKKRLSR